MRILVLAITMVGTIAGALPARAQTYNPDYPVCMQVYGPLNFADCRFTTIPQCAASASGRPAQCLFNPYFASENEDPVGRPHRRHRHHA
jgi:hypothetical protein